MTSEARGKMSVLTVSMLIVVTTFGLANVIDNLVELGLPAIPSWIAVGVLYFLPMANHNTGSIVNSMASVQWASSIRDYLACETVWFKGDWMDDVIVHDQPLCQNGFVELTDKPGLGIELDPDVVKAHPIVAEIRSRIGGVRKLTL